MNSAYNFNLYLRAHFQIPWSGLLYTGLTVSCVMYLGADMTNMVNSQIIVMFICDECDRTKITLFKPHISTKM